ncbi:nucleotide pyrophosphatase/phosphodiesterase-like isoform X2 [Oryza brachyantha]|uniref:nucleotide pyrophosphatase/phosphodiesterase-like isoform X2 n=1 Tax=Oryza brachyantha TaxID=4533 RepID=UPI001ADCC267|nr:nucleotide pyrophosphatase/phosphodiesterase-like isoform X2 [Oryza brachyantha]
MPGGIRILLVVLAAVAAAGGVAAVSAFSSSSRAGEQPLSLIAVHRATIGIDAAASVGASPRLLGVKGEDTAWVTVDFAAPHPGAGDWIGVFSPSNFNASTCPGSTDPGPVICSAPIKYQLANYSSNYGKSGRGTLKFQLINQRQDFSFALFTGGLSYPKLIAVSNKIAFANPKAPVYPRLAQGKSWNEMTVTWTSGYDIQEAYPFVEWGMKWNPPVRTAAGTVTFDRESLCGEPARTVGWRDPGFIHTAFLTDLWPNKEYYYKIGHMLPDGKVVWGKFYSFRAPPYPGQKSLQRVVIFGDMGKAERDGSNEYSNYQPGSLNTTDTLIKDLDNIDIVFHIGDITYANGYISQWDQFTQQVEPITARVPYMLASGNHERDWPNSGSFFNGTDSGGECGVLAETMYYTPTENRANYWYSTDYGMFRFCVADSEHDWREGTEQYAFIERCLATVDRKKQPWLVFIAHRVLGYSSGFFYGAGGAFAEPTARQSLQGLWQKYRVDLAFYGHVHNYERTCPVFEGQCASPERSRYSGAVAGTIHAVVGGGGSHLSNFTAETPPWSVYREMDYGFVKLTAFNYTSLLYEYRRSSDGKVYDSFTVHREYRDVLACVAGSCPPVIPPPT